MDEGSGHLMFNIRGGHFPAHYFLHILLGIFSILEKPVCMEKINNF